VRFALLGPLQVHDDGPIDIRGTLRRTLLARLLLEGGGVVPSETLIEVMWGERASQSTAAALYNQVMRLRQGLGDQAERVIAFPPGYRIRIEPGELDLDVFSGHCAHGRRALAEQRWSEAARQFSSALEIWRGRPLSGLPALEGHARVTQLDEERLQALEGRAQANLSRGFYAEAIPELCALTADHPLREAFFGQLMLALYRAGRPNEALQVYRDLRETLVTELGVEPTAAIRELHQQILRNDAALTVPRVIVGGGYAGDAEESARTRAGMRSTRRQLPTDVLTFAGRRNDISTLEQRCTSHDDPLAPAISGVSVIDGMAGVGKTALAVRVAHQVGHRFPHGQLFVDLCGYTPGLTPLAAEDALDQLLRSLDVPQQIIPAGLAARAALYRAKLAGTNTLIVLDNVSSAQQVLPLLPGTAGCAVLVTSRQKLAGLEDAYSLTLGELPDSDALSLLCDIAGDERVAPGDPAADDLVRMCGGVPLAVRVVASQLRRQPDLRPASLVDRLRADEGRLRHLRDESRDLSVLFQASYEALAPAERLLFSSLALVPGADFDAYAAANLIADDLESTQRTLDSLVDHNLLNQRVPGRYQFHDLLRLFAGQIDERSDPDFRAAAATRLFDFYEAYAWSADRYFTRNTRPLAAPDFARAPLVPPFADRREAKTRMRTERDNLEAAISASRGAPRRLVSLTGALATFFQQEGAWRRAAELHTAARATACSHGLTLEEANALWDAGRIRNTTGDIASAEAVQTEALAIYRRLGNRQGQVNSLVDLGRIEHIKGQLERASALFEEALTISRAIGDRQGEANVLAELGRVQQLTGDADVADELFTRSISLCEDVGDLLGLANNYINLAYSANVKGSYNEAVRLAESALGFYRDVESKQGQANALSMSARYRIESGDYTGVIEMIEESISLHEEIGFQQGLAGSLSSLGKVQLALSDIVGAEASARRGLEIMEAIHHRLGTAESQLLLGRVRAAVQAYDEAMRHYAEALSLFRGGGDAESEAETLNYMAELAVDCADHESAAKSYRQALSVARSVRAAAQEARALAGLESLVAKGLVAGQDADGDSDELLYDSSSPSR